MPGTMAVRPSSSFVSVTHDASRELRADREAADACAHVCVREREREREGEREREREREERCRLKERCGRFAHGESMRDQGGLLGSCSVAARCAADSYVGVRLSSISIASTFFSM